MSVDLESWEMLKLRVVHIILVVHLKQRNQFEILIVYHHPPLTLSRDYIFTFGVSWIDFVALELFTLLLSKMWPVYNIPYGIICMRNEWAPKSIFSRL